MSRFETIQRGKRARKTVDFPAPIDAEKPEERIKVDLVVLSGDEEAEAIEAAREFATKRGSTDPKQGDPHFDLGLMAHTLVRACLDPDVPGSFAFFFSSAEPSSVRPGPKVFAEMVAALLTGMDREAIHYLHQLQVVWQDYCSPWGKADDEDTILQKLNQLEGVVDPTVPFELFRPATLGSCFLTTVRQRAALLRDRSALGLSSEDDFTKNTRKPAEA